ncbi:hypothetical protein ACOJBO_42715 [Rhizobium beringeri]
MTMAYVEKFIGDAERKADFQKYRRHQIWQFVKAQQSLFRWTRSDGGREFLGKLSPEERRWALKVNALYRLSILKPKYFARIRRKLERELSAYSYSLSGITYQIGEHVTLFDVFRDIESGQFFETTRRSLPTAIRDTPVSRPHKIANAALPVREPQANYALE